MALNKVNIEFLRKQMDKVLIDIEKLKDSNRDMKYNGNGSYSTMMEKLMTMLVGILLALAGWNISYV